MIAPWELVISQTTAPNERYTTTLRGLRYRLFATHAGLWAERLTQAFWPLWSVVIAALALLMLGVQDVVGIEAVWIGGGLITFGALVSLWIGVRSFRRPTRAEAVDRVDARVKGRPLQTLRDTQAVGDDDDASRAVWEAHQARMAARAQTAEAVAPDLRVSKRDPYALRYVAALMLAVALLFGSLVRVGSVSDLDQAARLWPPDPLGKGGSNLQVTRACQRFIWRTNPIPSPY